MSTTRRDAFLSARLTLAVLVLLVAALDLAAQAVPAAQQAALFSRILAYDRNLKARAGAQVTVGIVFMGGNDASQAGGEQMVAVFTPLKARTIQDLPFDVVSFAYVDTTRFGEWLDAHGIDVVYLSPGLEAAFPEIQAAAAKRKVSTLTPQRSQVLQGAAIGVVVKDGKPGIVINLSSARALGMDLDPKLLQLAEVLR